MLLFVLAGCGTIKYVPVETKTEIRYVDSLRIKDSTVVIPIERIVDIVATYDTLKLETSVASSTAYVDTTVHKLVGKIENKQGVQYRYIYKDRIEYRDSIRTVEKPVPVEVVKSVTPKWAWSTLVFSILVILCFGIKFFVWLK